MSRLLGGWWCTAGMQNIVAESCLYHRIFGRMPNQLKFLLVRAFAPRSVGTLLMSSWGKQFSVGDQGTGRKDFWSTGYSACPTCQSQKITHETHCAGCRHNGDGYGTEVYKCEGCGWETSYQYDEACKSKFGHETLRRIFFLFCGAGGWIRRRKACTHTNKVFDIFQPATTTMKQVTGRVRTSR